MNFTIWKKKIQMRLLTLLIIQLMNNNRIKAKTSYLDEKN